MSGSTATVAKPTPDQLRRQQNDQFFKLIGYDAAPKMAKVSTIETVKKEVKKDDERRKKQHKIDLRDTKWEVNADAAIKEARIVLADISRLQPPSAPKVKILRDAINDTQTKLTVVQKSGDKEVTTVQVDELKSSTNALNKLLDGDLQRESLALFNGAIATANKTVPDLKDKLEPVLLRLQKGETPLLRDDGNRFAAELIGLARHLFVDEVSKGTQKWFGEQLTEITGRLKREEETARNRKETVDALRKRLPELDKLEAAAQLGDLPALDDTAIATMFRQKNIAENAYAVNDFLTATQTLRDLFTEVDKLSQQHGTAKDKAAQDWQRVAGDVGKLLSQAELLAQPGTLPEKLQKQAQGLVDSLQGLVSADVGTGIGYTAAVAQLEKARAGIGTLQSRGSDAVAFDPVEANGRVEQLVGEIKGHLQTLDQELLKQAKSDAAKTAIDGMLQPFSERLVAERLAWDEKVEAAFDDASLDEPTTVKALTQLKTEAQKACTGPGLAQAVIDMNIAAVRPAYEEARRRVMDLSEKLLSIDVEDGTASIKELESLDAAARTATDPALIVQITQDLDNLTKQYELTAKRLGIELAKARREVDILIKPVEGKLKELLEAANGMKDVQKQKPYETLHAALTTQYASVRALRSVDQIPVLQDALAEARLLVADLEDALAGAQGKKLKDKQGPDEARKMLVKYKADIADKTVQKYMAMTAADIAEKIEDLESSLGDQGLAKMREQMAEIGKLVEDVEKAAKDAEKNCKDLDTEVGNAKKVLAGSAFEKAPEYKKATEAKLKKLAADGYFEGGHDEALAAIKQVIVDLNNMAKGPPNVLGVSAEIADNEEKAVQSVRDGEIEKKKWDAEVKVLEKQLDDLAKKSNASEVEGLKTTLKEAKEAAEKSGDYALGRDQLQGIRGRAALVTANPAGLHITSRNKLPQVNARWRNAFKNFQAALMEVKKGVADTDLDPAEKGAVDKALTEVRCLFNPSAFESTVAAMVKQDATDKDRSAAREVGLRESRRMQAYLASDFRLRELMSTPFSKAMRSVISEMNLSLLDIENNMLVSM